MMDMPPQVEIYKNYDIVNVANAKYAALRSMDELEGWCSKEKAAVMFDLVTMLKPDVVVEIGVFGGKSLVPMAFAAQVNGKGIVYGIDPWDSGESVIGMDGANADFWGTVNHEAILQGLISKISKFGLNSKIALLRTTSEAAAPIENIDILHIDGNHSEDAAYIDATKWLPYVRKGGIIIFDDVNWSTTGKAVKYLDDNCIKFAEFHGDNIWGVWVKP